MAAQDSPGLAQHWAGLSMHGAQWEHASLHVSGSYMQMIHDDATSMRTLFESAVEE